MKVVVKWGKESYPAVELDAQKPVSAFRDALYALTGVPPANQKLMSKAWKGFLKDDVNLAGLPELKDGATVQLMGTADGIVKPVQQTVFVEDMSRSEIVKMGAVLPSGLVNMGNTCYLNSTLQCIRAVPELREALVEFRKNRARGGARGPFADVDASLAELFLQLDNSPSAIPPAGFVSRLRASFPQFAEQASSGAFKQQDAEEFESTIVTALANELKAPTPSVPNLAKLAGASDQNVVDTLFGLEFDVELKCLECPEEPVVRQKEIHRKLTCTIEGGAGKSVQVNHLHDGVTYGLAAEVEKRSEILGRNAMWTKTSRIARLPKYMMVQFMRFYWKATPESRDHAGVKCKMLRTVNFPADNLDVYEFCNTDVKSVLKVSRDKYADAALAEVRTSGAPANGNGASKPPNAAAVPARRETDGDIQMGAAADDDELARALALSMEQQPASGSSSGAAGTSVAATKSQASIGQGLPENFRGLYELFAVVTHKGRSADSGHYIAFVRHKGDDWFVFDDDSVEPTKTEVVTSRLKGGGDDHMAYMLFYRAKE